MGLLTVSIRGSSSLILLFDWFGFTDTFIFIMDFVTVFYIMWAALEVWRAAHKISI